MTPFDPGLQPERTELAWRRTALALGVGSLVAARLLPTAFGNPWWAFGGVAGLFAAALIWFVARQRARDVNTALARDGDRASLPDGCLLAVFTTLVVAGGSIGLVIVGTAAVTR
ncbi:DUF202 domain-containing protein [Microbacterium esteraromaticum]|uniref:DUF202 domain-containing protein n=1 Tax=Microbacterium esteraromaticum TaxID=57043 RepID=UPI0021BDD7BF|nr:DUF202 domain-containing protein [Microbacterium esteraromaticum]